MLTGKAKGRLGERVAALERGRDNPRRVNPRNPDEASTVPPAAIPVRTSPKNGVQLDGRDVPRLRRDLEEVNDFLDEGDAEAAQDQLDEIIAGIDDSADNRDD